jgi:hypothetical protein
MASLTPRLWTRSHHCFCDCRYRRDDLCATSRSYVWLRFILGDRAGCSEQSCARLHRSAPSHPDRRTSGASLGSLPRSASLGPNPDGCGSRRCFSAVDCSPGGCNQQLVCLDYRCGRCGKLGSARMGNGDHPCGHGPNVDTDLQHYRTRFDCHTGSQSHLHSYCRPMGQTGFGRRNFERHRASSSNV